MKEELSSDLMPLLKEVSKHVSEMFENQKGDDFLFHNVGHACFVEGEVLKLGRAEGLDLTQLTLVRLAAWLHDVGYLKDPAHHEEVGAGMAEELLKDRLSSNQLSEVRRLILSTRAHFKPEDLSAMILRDADSAYASTPQFTKESENLRREWETLGVQRYSDDEWLAQNLRYLENIRWNTDAAWRLYTEGLNQNIALLKQKIGSAKGKV